MQTSIENYYAELLNTDVLQRAFMHRVLRRSTCKETQQAYRETIEKESWRENIPLTREQINQILTCVFKPDNINMLTTLVQQQNTLRPRQLEKFMHHDSILQYVFPEACFYFSKVLYPDRPINRNQFYNLPTPS